MATGTRARSIASRGFVLAILVLLGTGYVEANGGSFVVRIGATLSMTGDYKDTAKYIKDAMEIFKEEVNACENSRRECPLKALGKNITINLTYKDDQSNAGKVKALYKEMADSSGYDMLLGPYSSGLSLEAAHATNHTDLVMMMYSAATPSIYVTENGHPRFYRIFAANPLATDYFTDALDMLWARGARTMVAARGKKLFHASVCKGARDYALKKGYTVLSPEEGFIMDEKKSSEIPDSIRKAQSLKPDVFIGCGHLDVVIMITITARALMFNPKAILMTASTSQTFVDKVEARNANYIMGPVIWHKEVDGGICKIFGSSQKFYDLFQKKTGKEPTYQAGMAAAALTVLMVAAQKYVEQHGTVKPDPRKLKEIMLSHSFPSFAGAMRFHANGSRVSGHEHSHTVQILPNTSNTSRMKYINKTQLEYPIPTWVQRELEVYPCPVGWKTSGGLGTCQQCPQGRSRNSASLECRPCGNNAYGDKPGLAECKPCERGMDCRAEFTGTPSSASGFYTMSVNDGSYKFFKCDPPELCLGSNKCMGVNEGVLCAQCPPFHAGTGFGVKHEVRGLCVECPSGLGSMAWLLLAISVYMCVVAILFVSDHSSAYSMSALHGVILKIIINYGQFMSTMVIATDFPMFKNAPRTRLVFDVFLNPVQSLLGLDCVSEALSLRPDKAGLAFGLVLLPAGLGASWLAFFLFALYCIRKARLSRQLLESGVQSQDTQTSTHDKSGVPTLYEIRSKSRIFVGQDGFESSESTQATAEALRSPSGDAVASNDFKEQPSAAPSIELAGVGTLPAKTLKGILGLMDPRVDQDIKEHFSILWTKTAVISLYILHPVAMRMLLSAIYCVQLDELRLQSDLSVVCNDGEHNFWFSLGVLGLVLYGVGIPLLTRHVLFRIKNSLMQIDVRRQYGFLYNGFETEYFNFEVWYMVRKFLILMAASIPDIFARVLTMLWLALIFMAAQISMRPWDNRGFFIFDKLESLSLLALVCSLGLRLGLELHTRNRYDGVFTWMEAERVEAMGLIFIGIIHFAFWALALWALFRNCVVKHLLFRRECLPGTLNCFQHFLCNMVAHHHNRMRMHTIDHSIDRRDLKKGEIALLHACLCVTLEHYIEVEAAGRRGTNGSEICLDHLGCAIREAFRRCEGTRAHKLEKLIREYHPQLLAGTISGSDEVTAWVKMMGSEINDEALKKAVQHFAKSGGVTVEEFQVALMICWPEILAGQPQYFTMISKDDKELAFNEFAKSDSLVWQSKRTLERMLDVLDRRDRNRITFETSLRQIIDKEQTHGEEKDSLHDKRVDVAKANANTFEMLGLQAAHAEPGTAPESVDDSEESVKSKLQQDHKEVVEEMVELEKEILDLRNRCIAASTKRRIGQSKYLATLEGRTKRNPANPMQRPLESEQRPPRSLSHEFAAAATRLSSFPPEVSNTARLASSLSHEISNVTSTGDALQLGHIDLEHRMTCGLAEPPGQLQSGEPEASRVWWPWGPTGKASAEALAARNLKDRETVVRPVEGAGRGARDAADAPSAFAVASSFRAPVAPLTEAFSADGPPVFGAALKGAALQPLSSSAELPLSQGSLLPSSILGPHMDSI